MVFFIGVTESLCDSMRRRSDEEEETPRESGGGKYDALVLSSHNHCSGVYSSPKREVCTNDERSERSGDKSWRERQRFVTLSIST